MEAKQVGSKLALKSVLIGLVMAYSIMAFLVSSDEGLEGLIWITDIHWWPNLLLGVAGLLLSAYYLGGRAGRAILEKNQNHIWTGIKYGFLILWAGTLIGSTLGFIQEGWDKIGVYDNPFFDYYFKPIYWVSLFGFIPVIIVGVWYGRQIKKNA